VKRAPLSLDLDNKWSYLKTHGDDAWESFPSYLDTVVPRFLGLMDRLGLRITVFMVGKDADLAENHEAMAAVASAGHEIGNHSYLHEPWLHLYSDVEIRTELERAHEAISTVTGHEPIGFRGPGFSMSRATLEVLSGMGYRYDATIFPNALNPVGRAYYFMSSNMSKEEREQRKELFGTFRDAFRPNKPFTWDLGQGTRLLEIPVTTMPGFRIPIHFSYVLFLAGRSKPVADLYFKLALSLCSVTGNPPSLLLHPLDFMGADDEPDLDFFPGMKTPTGRKLELIEHYLQMVKQRFDPVGVGDYASGLRTTRSRQPDFSDG
jgi:hypothetical protein